MFYHPEWDCRSLTHGDDFAVLGDRKAVEAFSVLLESKYSCKRLSTLGFGPNDDRSGVFLNRVITVEMGERPHALKYEPDGRHGEILVQELGMQQASGAETPAEHRTVQKT